jgi:hypothetical protein
VRRTEGRNQEGVELLPELVAWREVGWIFRDGDCIAIERQGDDIRSRVEEFRSRVSVG